MKVLITFILAAFLLISCNDTGTGSKPNTGLPAEDSTSKAVTIDSTALIMNLTKEILTVIKAKDYQALSAFFHPVSGTRFSPYGYIDTAKDVKFNATQFYEAVKNKTKMNWGNYDGSGEPILLSVEDYFKKFVYNADFLNAEKTSFNKMTGSGNSLNNLETIYKGCSFTESYFSGFDKKYEGMD